MTSKKQINIFNLYQNCRLCPRDCRVDRTRKRKGTGPGFCGETDQVRVAYVGPHFGEEPPITGEKGSGTVFFSGCGLQCVFCQNHQISRGGIGDPMDVDQLVDAVAKMVREHGVHNVNFVTPDHFLPHAVKLVSDLRQAGQDLPFVYNFSGYQSVDILKELGPFADIYLPDFKYSNANLAARLSHCRNYTTTALNAISEMVRQKSFLDTFTTGGPIAKKGVLVRHLILPGHMENSISALTSLYVEFGPELPLSLMSQYQPVVRHQDPQLNRKVTHDEFERVYGHVQELGFKHLFVQFPCNSLKEGLETKPFLPDFNKTRPFQTDCRAL